MCYCKDRAYSRFQSNSLSRVAWTFSLSLHPYHLRYVPILGICQYHNDQSFLDERPYLKTELQSICMSSPPPSHHHTLAFYWVSKCRHVLTPSCSFHTRVSCSHSRREMGISSIGLPDLLQVARSASLLWLLEIVLSLFQVLKGHCFPLEFCLSSLLSVSALSLLKSASS